MVIFYKKSRKIFPEKGNGTFLGEKMPRKGCHCHAKEQLGGVRMRLGSNDKKR